MNISVYKIHNQPVQIEQTPIKREWMEKTYDRHAYKCFPVSFANTIGWSISFTEDIEFIWDGVTDTTPDHVKILKAPENLCSLARGNATISFNTGLYFKTDENTSIISIVPPNYFIDGATPFTSMMSTSFYDEAFPAAWRITRANTPILIPAGMPVATLIPLSIGKLSEVQLDIHNKTFDQEVANEKRKYLEEWQKISEQGKFSNFYRDAVDYKGDSIGEHEKKSLHLKTNDYTRK